MSEFQNRTPEQEVLFDVVTIVNHRIVKYFTTSECKNSDIKPHELLVMVTANIFTNIANNLMQPRDTTNKIKAFELLNEELTALNTKLFLMLETYYNADENTKN